MSQIRKIHSIFHGRTFLSHYCIVHQSFFFVMGKKGHISLLTRSRINSKFRKKYKCHNTLIYQQTYHFFVSSGHWGWIIHETPISDAYCVWWQSLRLLSPRKARHFAAGTVLCAILGLCALKLLKQCKQFQWPQLWRQLFAHRLWWQKCVVGFPLTACPNTHTTHTHTHKQFPCHALHTHFKQKRCKTLQFGNHNEQCAPSSE